MVKFSLVHGFVDVLWLAPILPLFLPLDVVPTVSPVLLCIIDYTSVTVFLKPVRESQYTKLPSMLHQLVLLYMCYVMF